MRQEIEAVRKRLEKEREGFSPAEALTLLNLLDQTARKLDRVSETNRNLESRIATVENSRFFWLLRKAGTLFQNAKLKAGQVLLHSPFHSLYLEARGGDPADREYGLWLSRQLAPEEPTLAKRPLLSVIMPVHNPRREWLEEAINSVTGQRYPNWQLCICDDASDEPWVKELLTARNAADPRILFVRSKTPAGISGASNQAARLAQGEYFGFLDHDDLLSPYALEAVAQMLQERDYDLIYTDEDRINPEGKRVKPIFRPGWSPDLLTSCMYMGHFLVVSRDAWEAAGGLRGEYDGAQDYDLALRVTERSGNIGHIPHILYHWRMHGGSTAADTASKPATHQAGRRALENAMQRRGREARIEDGHGPNHYRAKPVVHGPPLASIVICSRNAERLSQCLESIERKTDWRNRELVIVQHRTLNDSAMDSLLARVKCTHIPYSGKFNYAAMNNMGAQAAQGEILVFMNDDVSPLAPDWLTWLAGQALRPEIGAAGPKLLYPSGTIQHAGIAAGIMDGTGHPLRGTMGSPYWGWLECARNVSAVTGACAAIRADVFRKVGGFDPIFPVNYNDVDLCLRLRATGYEIVYEPAATLRHEECATRAPGIAGEERETFLERWSGVVDAGDPFYHPALTRKREDAGLDTD